MTVSTDMGNNKVKTSGQLQGKKGNGQKNLHPNSRRLKQAVRVDLRTKRVELVRRRSAQNAMVFCLKYLYRAKERINMPILNIVGSSDYMVSGSR